MKIGIIDHIDCAHSLPGHPKCGTPHGHTYKVECVIEGNLQNGMVMDFADLKQAVHQTLARYDHQARGSIAPPPDSSLTVGSFAVNRMTYGFNFRLPGGSFFMLDYERWNLPANLKHVDLVGARWAYSF
jgi:6-pyruvoyl tetrahydropterin synthase/QueD family protein